MGWCGGTEIFDAVAAEILEPKNGYVEFEQKRVLRILANALEENDWDCQSDSKYYEHLIVKEIFDELSADRAARRGG